MLLNNVFSGLTQVAKSVIGFFGKDEADTQTLISPTARPLSEQDVEVLDFFDRRKIEADKTRAKNTEELKPSDEWKIATREYSGWVVQVHKSGKARVISDEMVKECMEYGIDLQWVDLNVGLLGANYVYAKCQKHNQQFSLNLTFEVLNLFVEPKPKHITNGVRTKVIFADGNRENINAENLSWASLKNVVQESDEAHKSTMERERFKRQLEQGSLDVKKEKEEAEKEARRAKNRERYSAKKERERVERLVAIRQFQDGIVEEIAEKDAKKAEGVKLMFDATNAIHGKELNEKVEAELHPNGEDLYWVPVPGYKGMYEISNYGYVRSLDREIINSLGKKQRFKGKVLKRYVISNGYLGYTLSREGKSRECPLAALMVLVFMKDKLDKTRNWRLKHKDGHNGNFHIDNLEIEYL